MALGVVPQAACGGSPPSDPDPLDGADLVAGTSIPRHGLLVVPRSGGPAELRAIDNPSRIRWAGTADLPPSVEAHALDRSIVLRSADGSVSVFQPSGELIREVGTVPDGARWVQSDRGGAFVWGTRALVVTDEESRSLDAGMTVTWAAPAAGDRSVLLTVSEDGPRLELWEGDASEPTSVRAVDSRGPALLTAWGTEVVLGEGDGGRRLVAHTLPDLEPTEETTLGRSPVFLASSPSQHRLFVASAGESRIEAIDRYAWEPVERTATGAPVTEVRPGVTGDVLLAFDGAQIWAVRAGSSDRVEIGSDWRADLPLGLPGGVVLGAITGTVRLFDLVSGDVQDVEGPADAWWLPVRWTPRRVEPAVSAPDLEETAESLPDESEARERGLNIGLLTAGRVAGRRVATLPSAPSGLPSATDAPASTGAVPGPDPFSSIPGGFYAVASSSRQLESLGRLRRSLEDSGYPTEVLSRRDEANDLWYRLMVGPYASRDDAEDAARSLQRERGISAWIHESFGPGQPR